MRSEPGSPEQIMEERIHRLIDDLDELCAMATNPRTVALVDGQRIAIGQVQTRATLLSSFLIARAEPPLKLVGRG